MRVLYKKSKGLGWIVLIATIDCLGWLAANKFLDYVLS